MKRIILAFCRRGFVACGFGPLILAALYLILQQKENMQILTVDQVCLGIVSLSGLAFIAGGMNVVYQIERLPLMAAILLHGTVLYISYMVTYLVNGWLKWGTAPILVFSVIFILGYLAVWAVIYIVTKKRTDSINAKLKQMRGSAEENSL